MGRFLLRSLALLLALSLFTFGFYNPHTSQNHAFFDEGFLVNAGGPPLDSSEGVVSEISDDYMMIDTGSAEMRLDYGPGWPPSGLDDVAVGDRVRVSYFTDEEGRRDLMDVFLYLDL